MSAQDLSQLALDTAHSVLAKLPPYVQRALLNSYVQKALGVLVALRLVKGLNSYLSKRAQNNGQRISKWSPQKELIVLTGGCSGIGKQIMEDLSRMDVKTIILDLNEPNFSLPPNVFFYAADVTSRAVVRDVAGQIRKDHGYPTTLINNAGVGLPGTILDEPDENIRLTMEVNTLSHFWTVKEFLPSMIQRDHGHIITLASAASFVSLGEAVDYACSKASALAFHEGLTQEIRHWYGSKKVRTSIIHPSWVRTPMIDAILKAGKHWTQPVMGPEEVSSAVTEQLVSGNGGQVVLPRSHGLASLVRGLPNWLQERVRDNASKQFVRLRQLEKKSGL